MAALMAAGCRQLAGLDGIKFHSSCSDEERNDDETDVDCGGSCAPCADAGECLSGSDCESGICSAGICETPSCGDGVQNGGEVAIDCGGACAGLGTCDVGQPCAVAADCSIGECTAGACAGDCADGLLGGGETDIDCGGPACSACDNGHGCAEGRDCLSGACRDGVCVDIHVWSESFGVIGSAEVVGMAVDEEGDVVLAGTFKGTLDLGLGPLASASPDVADIFVVKLSASGKPLWVRKFGAGSEALVGGVAVDADGDVLLSGGFAGTIDFGGGPLESAGGTDVFSVWLSGDSGSYLWSESAGDMASQRIVAMAPDTENNFIIVGEFEGVAVFGPVTLTSAGGRDVFVVKHTGAGDIVWARSFGGALDQAATSVAVDASDDILVGGTFEGTIEFDDGPLHSAGAADYFVVKLDPDGDYDWSARVGNAADQKNCQVAMAPGGAALLAGEFVGALDFDDDSLQSAGGTDGFVARWSASGNPSWAIPIGDAAEQSAPRIAVSMSGDVLVVGGFHGAVDLGGGPLISAGDDDVFVAKLDSQGEHVWSRSFGDPSRQSAALIAPRGLDEAVITGTFAGSIDFGGGPIMSQGPGDIFATALSLP